MSGPVVYFIKLNGVLNVLIHKQSVNLYFIHHVKRRRTIFTIRKCYPVSRIYYFFHLCNLGHNECSHTRTRCSVAAVVHRRGEEKREGGGVAGAH